MNSLSENSKPRLWGDPWPPPQFGQIVPTGKLLARTKSESGQIIVLVAVMLLAIIAILGLVVDSGLVHAARRQARRAADAAAQAGAYALCSGTNATYRTNATTVAHLYASLNGINTNANVVVQIPPGATSGSVYTGSNGYIFVQVTLPVNTTFLRLLTTQQTVNVTAAATGGVKLGPCPLTILVLHPTESGALSVKGGAVLEIPGGAIGVNSSSDTAVVLTGGAALTCSTLNVVGDVSGTTVATVHTGVPAMADPFGHLVAPVLTSSTTVTYGDGTTGSTSPDSGGTAGSPAIASPSGITTLRPGIYWGGIKITGGDLTFQPGRYVMAGGGFEIGGSPTILGTNVFFYNTRDPYSGSSAAGYGHISVSGSSTIMLKSPTTAADSTYGGFLFFSDRANGQDVNVSGGSSSSSSGPLTGFIYAAAGEFKVTGGGYLGGLGAVVREMQVSGNAKFSALEIGRVPSVTTAGLTE
ncbi:MAG: pilus assembly protein TadG-related protein [Verrucomicrobiia bacterium]|jgi:hypothetical protein